MFNKETQYALRSLVYVQLQNLKGKRPGTIEIAREIEAPQFFTAKILQRLVRAGFVESVKGKGGGFYFETGKSDLTLERLIISVEGNRSFSSCGFGLKNCNENNPCPLHEKYAPVRKKIFKLVSEESIQSLAKKVRKKELKLKNL
ncbi:MAG TPA: Rrf2 family transcriptional regulator [Bacteroidales bacterium]|nr:Rrf2 family transcriptional regulator [Bacteroidales bacterium]